MGKTDDAWDRRVLCSDGNCIGVIGNDGRCKLCGKPFEGELPLPVDDAGPPSDEGPEDPGDHQDEQADHPVNNEAEEGGAVGDDSWENRTLCIDESCIGIVGPDGRCKECGTPYPK
jgi:hypothetical protein